MLEPKDDLRHLLRPSPHSRESLFYDLILPDQGLMVFFYTWVDADDRAGHLFAVLGEGDEPLAFHATDGVDVGGRDFDDWAVDGLWVRHTDLLRTAEIGFDADGVSFRARFTGVHDAFDYARNADGCPDFIADNRFEQSTRVVGSLTVGDPTVGSRTVAIDATGHRDHSWGTRDWDAIQDWKWISAQAGPELSLNVFQMHARGETTRHGYVYRDGALSAVVDIRTRAEYDERWWQTALEMTVRDALGRETALTARTYALLRFEAGERIVLHEAACRGEIDGRAAAIHFENGWDKSYVEAQTRRLQN